jgi:hypothetical protein
VVVYLVPVPSSSSISLGTLKEGALYYFSCSLLMASLSDSGITTPLLASLYLSTHFYCSS